ncbi:MAG: hypothetical protein ABI877_07540 [Gemmatimonadaceae bacterium]
MSNRKKQLQLHIDVPVRKELFPAFTTIPTTNIKVGDQTGSPSAFGPKKAPRYADVGNETMSPEMIMRYRARIAAGVYDAPATIEALAEALLASGEL